MANKIELAIEALNKTQAAFNDAKRQITDLENTAKKGSSSIGSAIATLKQNWLGLTATITAVTLAVRQAFEYMEKGAKAQQAEESFHKVAQSLGEDAEYILSEMKRVSNGTVDDSDIMQKAIKGLMQDLKGNELVEIMSAARVAARVSGQDIRQTYETITDAITNKMPRGLLQYGLITREQMRLLNQAMAMGVTEIDIYSLVMENAGIQVQKFGEIQDTNAEKLQRWKVLFNEIKENVGKGIFWIMDNVIDPLIERIEKIGTYFAKVVSRIGVMWDWMMSIVKGAWAWIKSGFSTSITDVFVTATQQLLQAEDDLEERYDEQIREIETKHADKLKTSSLKEIKFNAPRGNAEKQLKDIVYYHAQVSILESKLVDLDSTERWREISHLQAAEQRVKYEQDILGLLQKQYSAKDSSGEYIIKDPNARAMLSKQIDEAKRKILEFRLALRELNGSFDEGIKEGLAKYLDSIGSTFQQAQRLAQDAAQGLQSAFSDFFFDVFQGKLKSLRDYITSFLNAIGKAVSNYLSELAVAGLIKGVTKLFSSPASGDEAVQTQHSGGYIMHSGGFVPRFHIGGNLAPDERAAILQTGEYVVSRKGVAALDKINSGQIGGSGVNVVVNVQNQTNQQLDAKSSEMKFDGEKYIVGVILKNADGYGPLYHLFKQGGK